MVNLEDGIYQKIISSYRDTASVDKAATVCGVSKVTVRRVLITEGLWSSPRSEEIGRFHERGMSVTEIAKELSVTENAVKAYMPYTRGKYGDKQTPDSRRSKGYRERKNSVAKKMHNQIEKEEAHSRKESEPMDEYAQVKAFTENLWTALRPDGNKIEDYARLAMLRDIMHVDENESHKFLRLHIELEDADYDEDFLKAAKAEKAISRDIVVPEDMTLHALHFAIQKLFGFLSYHLYNFQLTDQDFNFVTASRFGGYTDLCGALFRFPNEYESDFVWDADYTGSCSVNTWYRRKYTAPYKLGCISDTWYANSRAVAEFYKENPQFNGDMVVDEVSEKMWLEQEWNFLREDMPIGDLLTLNCNLTIVQLAEWKAETFGAQVWASDKLDEMLAENEEEYGIAASDQTGEIDRLIKVLDKDIMQLQKYEGNSREAARLKRQIKQIKDCLDYILEELTIHPKPIFREICYRYDYGDGWCFKISLVEEYHRLKYVCLSDNDNAQLDKQKSAELRAETHEEGSMSLVAERGVGYLVNSNEVESESALERYRYLDSRNTEVDSGLRAILAAVDVKGRPQCVAVDGLNLIDDVGGPYGFREFLNTVTGKPKTEEEKEKRRNLLDWARSQGWTGRKSKPEKML